MERLLNGRYRIGPKIGDGGMAIVYRGFDTLLGRSVAIKVLREQYAADRTFVARFEREAQAIAALVHPNIVNIFDVGFERDDVGHYFVMELIDGPNLKEFIRSRGSLSVDETVAILTDVLAGLGYAHARALVHRDVKPQNIMLTPDGTAKVTDFGIAKGPGDATLTEAGFGMGTVHYISPEQARGEQATPSSDLYAVGVMLYEMLTGVLPFTGDSTVSVALKHLQEAPLSPKRLNPAIPAPLAALTLRALAKDPGERFASAREMAAALADWPRWRDARAPLQPEPRQGQQRAVRGNGGAAARRSTSASRGGVGCVTWFAGVAVLAALIALIVVGYRLSPFGEVAADPTTPISAGLPTQPPDPPTATPEGEPPTVTVPAAATTTAAVLPGGSSRPATATTRPSTAPSPTVRPTQVPSVTATVSPTVRPSATVTPTAALVNVPDLTGKTLKEAQAIAAPLGLTVEQVGEGYSSRPVGQVIEQQPAAGKQLAKGGTITVVISRGPQTAQIPDVKGQGYDQAAAQLEKAGLVVARNDVPSRNVPKGVVIDQDPLPTNEVKVGSTVTLTVSLGDVIQVPDLFGVPIDVARQRLTDAGFVLLVNGQSKAEIEKENPTFFTVYPEVRDGWVISQSLPAGSFQPRGTTIAIAYYKAK